MAYLLLGVVLLAGLYLLARAFVSAEPRAVIRAARFGGIAAGAVALGFLAYSGRLSSALVLAGAALPLIARWRTLFSTTGVGRKNAKSGGISRVETLFLRMSLDHDSGAMTGEVVHGPWKGRRLDQLALDQLLTLLADCRREDPPSVAVLEAWLDRTSPDWRSAAGGAGEGQGAGGRDGERSGGRDGGGGGRMSRQEACEILDLPPDASVDQIKEAHKRLMMKVHPDHGGSTYLAAKINQAKDLLLRR